MRFFLVLLAGLCACLPLSLPAARVTEDFDADWLFSRDESASAMMPAIDDSRWQSVILPHDWSSDGPFGSKFASGTGYAPGGIGWYRKHFLLDTNQSGKSVAIEFDGIYDWSEVWINGQFVGQRPYGYSSFRYDLTPYVNFGPDGNVVAVRVDHSRFADSRYYTGSGIYRNVRLVVADKLHIAHWGVVVTSSGVTTNSAEVQVETTIEGGQKLKGFFSLETDVVAPSGIIVGNSLTSLSANDPNMLSNILTQKVMVRDPRLWNLNDPALYHTVSKIMSGNKVIDDVSTQFGIREVRFDADKGFFLNGKSLKIKGVCLHHDAGPIGAAVPAGVWERRLLALKQMGVNAIRTSHNPPDPVLLDLCDQLGFLVMDEAFDEFTPAKNKWIAGVNIGKPSRFGYAELFAQWSVTDITDIVRRDRNHPSIILWSIGNEIDFANDPFSDPVLGEDYRPDNPPATDLVKCAAPLVEAVKSLDRTRPVTAALATVRMSNVVGLPELLDAAGYNYQENRYAADHAKFPRRIIYGSENSQRYEAWRAVATNNFICGQFLWTGIDYLGEANAWPNRANGAGLLDLCGFKKPLGWFRQSLWSDQPMVYLCANFRDAGGRRVGGTESWNWPTNTTVTVLCFANCPEVTLMLNGKAIGTKNLSEARRGVLRWEFPYESGTLQAIGYDENGRRLSTYSLQTAGAPAQIELVADRLVLRADGKDVCHVEFRIEDANGVRVPDGAQEVTFTQTGPARILGIGNGDINSVEDCKANTHRAYEGRGLVILSVASITGDVTLSATSPGLKSASTTLRIGL
ncbi:MAG TPA: glycoside hydrolase family 2 TIM barrel-domain containing protein [Candidatus Acidoferrum sp.]|nr:glycoside hydrolase family 2 TIM barrel-domain containing protein [Candidatus Acidoferrum sp.]